jgi:hypothetical protein
VKTSSHSRSGPSEPRTPASCVTAIFSARTDDPEATGRYQTRVLVSAPLNRRLWGHRRIRANSSERRSSVRRPLFVLGNYCHFRRRLRAWIELVTDPFGDETLCQFETDNAGAEGEHLAIVGED